MPTVCVTGATGFIGKNLLNIFSKNPDWDIIALSRKVPLIMDGAKKGNITWRRCNGFSLLEVEKATAGADIIIYLIHSMLPSTTLTQGSFREFDLYLADNFARAAIKNNINRVIYLSGLIPKTPKLSKHLYSRLEVENILIEQIPKVTVLRAGLIVGKDGSSFKILERLIKRLPALLCPAWTMSNCQPIDLDDVLASIIYSMENPDKTTGVFDIGGPDVVSYRQMLVSTANALGLKRLFLNVPFFSPGLSKLWVSNITSTSSSLVYPLVDSLRHSMVVDEKQQLIVPEHRYKNFKDSLKDGLSKDSGSWVRIIIDYNMRLNFKWLENVSSIQTADNIENFSAKNAAEEYFKWLPNTLRPFIQVKNSNGLVVFKLFSLLKILILKRNNERSTDDRVVYYIVGGVLARSKTLNGRLEFRYVAASKSIVLALLDFRPSLPWFVYKCTQAIAHLYIMNRFAKHLAKLKT